VLQSSVNGAWHLARIAHTFRADSAAEQIIGAR
jgi:hypothetical protein